jgi:nucleoside-diphosphate-sugar epimerase
MKLLITGGSGFLGINLIRYLYSRGHEIVSLDIVDFDYPDINGKIKTIKGDIRDEAAVEEASKDIDIVVHTAAALPLYKPEDIYLHRYRWNKKSY